MKAKKPVLKSTTKVGKKVTLKPSRASQKPIKFTKGGLHASTNTPMGKKISTSKKKAALSGKLGAKAKKQAMFAANVLTGKK